VSGGKLDASSGCAGCFGRVASRFARNARSALPASSESRAPQRGDDHVTYAVAPIVQSANERLVQERLQQYGEGLGGGVIGQDSRDPDEPNGIVLFENLDKPWIQRINRLDYALLKRCATRCLCVRAGMVGEKRNREDGNDPDHGHQLE
jgi:hypothetical protein